MFSFKGVCLYLYVVQNLQFANAGFDVLKREPGVVYQKGNDSSTKFEVFIDLMCSQSKAVFPALKNVANYYGPERLELIFHLFPLAFFRNSHKVTKGALIVHELSHGGKTNDWIESIFGAFDELTNYATNNKTEIEIMRQLADIAEELGINRSTFYNQLTSSGDAEKSARMVHRYGCSRAVLTVPTFYINGFQVPATHTWTAEQFQKEIDDIYEKR
ncbi:hypothetical protein LOTGIDRAFT_203048 [Lottia gigantea]|uniref:Thioredoxin-like fold domain-containing protein n=1 Tax=Lottia gigantea TaxID=225164 RepID=V4ASA0_LOTGI|nr:hypothetical protein LOTGIDRAFT_203048 [Lottia gigantea]ESO97750.1 hypothetical protein LOTGIDRAFT_203048 [Lottia gigantea]